MSSQLKLKQVSVAYDEKTVIEDVSITLDAGEIGCLLGPSGCGKTSLLRAIAGFEPVSNGRISLDGKVVSDDHQQLPPESRNIGMVFQDFALFPHLSVAKNIGFGLNKLPTSERDERINELLALTGLTAYKNHYPHQISGGQQQRVALARAMAPRPAILLLDEPFSSIDSELREQLAREVRSILKQDNITAILVTHDQIEAFAMADNIAVLGHGRLQQWDTAYRLYHNPCNRFVAEFIGQSVMLAGTVSGHQQIKTQLGLIEGELPDEISVGDKVDIVLRPDDVLHDDDSELRLSVQSRAFRGAEYIYTLKLPEDGEIYCLVQSHHDHQAGEMIGIQLDLHHLAVFPRRSEAP